MAGAMTHRAGDVVRALLADRGLATLASAGGDWPAFAEKEPGEPDNVITCYTTEGRWFGRTQPDAERQGHYGVQVRVRGTTSPHAGKKADDIAIAMDAVYDESVSIPQRTVGGLVVAAGTYNIHSVRVLGDVISGGDESPVSKRQLYFMNLEISMRQTA